MFRKSWLLAIITIFILSFSWSVAVIKADDASTPVESESLTEEIEDNESDDVNEDGNEDDSDATEEEANGDNEDNIDEDDIDETAIDETAEDEDSCEIGIAVYINSGETMEICAQQTLHIENSGSYIVTPEGLPDGTTITVTDAREEAYVINAEEEQGLLRTGDAYDIELNMPDEELNQPFTLNLTYDSTTANSDIYYYDDGTWIKQDGFETVDDQISIDVDHFSSYAVFADSSGEPEPDPKPEPGEIKDPEPKVCEEELVYTLGKDGDMEICADQKVNFLLDDSDEELTIDQRALAYIKTPSDLPDGTTINVTDIEKDDSVKKAETEQDLIVCGPILSFDLTLPDGTSFSDSFMLHMIFCNGGDNPDIYYYDEDNKKWEKQNAEIETKTPEEMEENSQITMFTELDSFSSYGVFDGIDESSEPSGDNGDDEEKKPSAEDNGDEKPDDDSTMITVEDGDDEIVSDGDVLPSTATNLFNYLLIGGGLLVAGLLVYFLRRKFATKQ